MTSKTWLIILPFLMLACGSETEENSVEESPIEVVTFENYFQKISYAIGLDQGSGGRVFYTNDRLVGKFDLMQIKNGMVDYLASNPLQLETRAVDSVLALYLKEDGSVDSSIISKSIGSYAVGMNEAIVLVSAFVGRGIDQEIVPATLVKGIEDGFSGVKTAYKLKDAQFDVATYYADINKKNGEAFLAENKKKEGIIETASGLQYKIFAKGNGPKPNTVDSVAVHYVGRFISGEEFESSINSSEPIKFGVLQVIKGWSEGLLLMNEGAKYRFYIPYNLAYGESGAGPIEPYSALVFDIELVEVIKYKPNF
ncbi:MAG: FKBP-type peptidyl-prolyl cis-trans isomerase [Putridiphycobacter sp.]|nr:FKBP-type peptidyl-prolyl cis-trans isomerase [Putridiphycobacter sp.]